MISYPIPPEPLRVSISPPFAERPGRILFVDANQQRRALVQRILDAEGYEVVYLPDGDDALNVVSDYQPDLIMLAVELPSGSGLELCGELRASDPRRHYPVLLLGDDSEERSVERGLLAGADDFMAQPIRELELRARIRVQLRNKRFYDTLERVRDERDSLRRDAQIDPLTNVLNRRSLESLVRKRCEARERFGVLFIDLDHFKQVNDRFGHDCGDRVLISVANMIRFGLRPGDAIGRYGGEEFVAIVAGAGLESARLVAERLRQSVEEMIPPSPGPSQVTISIGATVFDASHLDESYPELVRRADIALYAAKRRGRNRVVLAPPGELSLELQGQESQHPSHTSVAIPPEPQILIGREKRSR